MASRVLQQLLDAHYPTFAETHPLPDYVRDAVHALGSCRTAALGGHVQACPEGHVERVWYNSCLMESIFLWGVSLTTVAFLHANLQFLTSRTPHKKVGFS